MSAIQSSPWLIRAGESCSLQDYPTRIADENKDARELKKELRRVIKKISACQRKLYADNRMSVLFVFQAMDAAGKDSTIRSVFSGVNPAGFQVHAFKKPSDNELDHDFLWRSAKALPQRGRIGVFNRSYYEEVLVVRVHEGILDGQRLPPDRAQGEQLWEERLQSIADHEKHLARNGTQVVKFFLNVSKEEQAKRFIARIDEPEKNWKFNPGDLRERARWADYQHAYEQALSHTSTDQSPWYAVPADDKARMRLEVAKLVLSHLEALPLEWPTLDADSQRSLQEYRQQLASGEI